MNSYKDKIKGHKSQSHPQLWENMEQRVLDLNDSIQGESNRRITPSFFSFLSLGVFIIALGLLSIWFLSDFNNTDSNELTIVENQGNDNADIVVAAQINQRINETEDQKIEMGDSRFLREDFGKFEQNQTTNTNVKSEILKAASKRLSINTIRVEKGKSIKKIGNDPNTVLDKLNANHSKGFGETIENQNFVDESAFLIHEHFNKKNPLASDIIEIQNDDEPAKPSLSIEFLENRKIGDVLSLHAVKKIPSPCKPISKRHFFELGASFGPSQNHYYPGYFTTLMIDYRVNKLIKAGIRYSYQRYTDPAKYITAPDVFSNYVYTNLSALISLELFDYKRFSMAIDFAPGIQLVSENSREQNNENFYISTRQYHGFNYMIGAHIDYQIFDRWKLGFESTVDINGETTLHGLRIKYKL